MGHLLRYICIFSLLLMPAGCEEFPTENDFEDDAIEENAYGIFGVKFGGVDWTLLITDDCLSSHVLCFEDGRLGDYDMNDAVVSVERISKTEARYSVLACGTTDEVYLRNINAGPITDNAELHALFGKTHYTLINVTDAEMLDPVSGEKQVKEDFKLSDTYGMPYLYNATTKTEIHFSKFGEPPFCLIVPIGFRHPKEGISISDAYPYFLSYVFRNGKVSDWYKRPLEGAVSE